MYCINISHPEYKNLLYNSKIDPIFLKAKISMWMDYNGNDSFPTIEELTAFNTNNQEYYNTNPVKAFAKLFNMNTAGFMPFNIDLAQAQRGAAKLGFTVAKSRVNTWYLKNEKGQFINPFNYKQLETSNTELPQQELKDKLMAFAKTHGIEVTTMEEMIDRAGGEEGRYEGVVGVANLLQSLIAIDLSKEKIDTLAEEIAHFATSILKDDASVKRSMKEVVNTEMYKEVKETYADIYTTEEQFRKEAMDKLLTQSIVEEFKETNENKGIVKYLQATFNKFMRWVNSKLAKGTAADQIKKDLMPLVKSILANEYVGKLEIDPFINESPEYLQKEKKKEDKVILSPEKVKTKFIEATVKKLEDRLISLKRQANKQGPIDVLSVQVTSITKKLELAKFDAAISSIVELAMQELGSIENLLDKHLAEDIAVGNTIDMVFNFAEMYEDLFSTYKNDMHTYKFPEEEQTRIAQQLDNAMTKINNVLIKNNTLAQNHIITILDEGNLDHNGNKIDENFNALEIFEKSFKDISYWRLGVGNYKNATSGVLRVAHKMIYNANSNTKRLAVEKGNLLLQAQVLMEKSGVKQEELIDYTEVNGKKKYTQFLIREWDWAGYYAGFSEVQKDIAETLGFENFGDINKEDLDKTQLSVFNKAFKNYYSANRVKLLNEEGRFIGYRPSARNPKFTELMSNPNVKNYYTLLVNTKKEALAKLPIQYRTQHAAYMLPGIRSQFLERMTNGNNSFFHNITEIARESFFIDQDDTQFGEVSALNNKMVPIYFTKSFDNPGDVSQDLTRSFTIFAEMAENLKAAGGLSGSMNIVLRQLGNRDYITKSRGTSAVEQKGTSTKEYKALQVLIDSAVYGIEKIDIRSDKLPENAVTKALGIDGKVFSGSKFMSRLSSFIRTNNLALNPVTSTAGAIKGSVDSILEQQIGLYTTVESGSWARAEYAKNIFEVLSQTMRKKQTNKMHLMLQRNNVVELSKMLSNTNRNKLLSQATSKDLLYVNYQTADYALKGRIALAIYDNIRYVDGEYITRKQFREKRNAEKVSEKEQNVEWKAAKEQSLYNAYEVVDGQLVIKESHKDKVTDAVENFAVGKVDHVAHMVDGTLSESDKGAIARTIYGDFVLMHRGWFINMIDSRVMPEVTNLISGEKEIGIYRASLKFIREELIHNKKFRAPRKAYKDADPVIQRGVKRTALDLLYLNIIGFLAALANMAADDGDEDDFLLQYTAYQMNRVLLEQGAPWSPSELLQMIDEPVVGVRTIKELVDISEAWNSDVYERGMYAGSTHRAKWWLRKTPFKGIYESQYPAMKNNFIKQVVDSKIYNLLKDDDENKGNGMGFMDRLKLVFADEQSMSDDEVMEVIQYMEDE